MKQIKILNPENSAESEIENYSIREAVRAVVFDENNNVAILHVRRDNYYKLPGGGIEEGEDKMTALQRECLEEIGCSVKVTGEIGIIVENRKMFEIKQVSYCYLAQVESKKGKSNFTQEEIDEGFEQIWVPYKEALKLVSNNITKDKEGKFYIVPRDALFLEESRLTK